MPSPVRVKFRALPWTVEYKLIQKYDFVVHSRKQGEWVILQKRNFKDFTPVDISGMTEESKKFLLNRIKKIVDFYDHPDRHETSIRLRIRNFCMGLNPPDRQFVQDWLEKTYPDKEKV